MVLPALFRSIAPRNSNVTNALILLVGGGLNRDPLSLRTIAKQLGIGRETLRVAALDNYNFKSELMTLRVENGLARINQASMIQRRDIVEFELAWSGETALNSIFTPLNNGQVPSMVRFTTYDPEQVYISEGSGRLTSAYTTSQAVPIFQNSLADTATQTLGLDANKVKHVTFR